MKTIAELDNLIDGSSKRGLMLDVGTAQRREYESEVIFYRECRTMLIAMNEPTIKSQLEKTKKMLDKYQAAKIEAEKNTSSAKVKAALKDAADRFKPEQLRKQERILMFIIQQ